MAAPKGKGASGSTDTLIAVADIVTGKKGRTAKIDPAITASLKKLPRDGSQALVLGSFAGTEEAKRGTVRARILAHWRNLYGPKATVSVKWNPTTGAPQVTAKPDAE